MTTTGIVLAGVVTLSLVLIAMAAGGARAIMKHGPMRMLLITAVGIASGMGASALSRSYYATAALTQQPPPARGCCYTKEGRVAGVTEEFCYGILGGYLWEYGECGTGAPLGCCLDSNKQMWHWVSEKECYGPLDGVLWADGPCPK